MEAVPTVVVARPRAPRKIAVDAELTTLTCRPVSCCLRASSVGNGVISITLLTFDYAFEAGASYHAYFDSELLPRKIALCTPTSGSLLSAVFGFPTPHAFSLVMDTCFIQKFTNTPVLG